MKHLTEERLNEIATTEQVQDDEDRHLAHCEQCMKRFVQLLKEIESLLA
jgi:hypothetical protein